ncbi:MAG TPA: hypothetical protein VFZ69_11310 [Longimicrobiales bacterium]
MRAAEEQEAAARDALVRAVGALTGEAQERRHEALMEWAEGELGLERPYAEQIYALAEEEDLEPVLAFELVRTGIGVRELEPPEQDMDEAAQQAPPEWVAEEVVELNDVALERRLRASFRRLRSHVETSDSPAAAVEALLRDPDVGLVPMR